MAIGRKDVISKYGFEHLLKFEKTELPSHFTRWIVGCVDTISSQIIIDDQKIISLSKESVHLVLGLPNNGIIAMPNKERGRSFIMSRFNLSEIPNVTFFGNLLTSSEDLSDEDIFICFMVIVMSCFLFPSANDHIHTDFLFLPEDPTITRGFDMCLLVYEWILAGINQYVLFGRETGRKPKAFDFCIYCLAVLYLGKLDFGIRVVEQGVPWILAWKGNLIKHFSELDRKKRNLFGRRPFKKEHVFATEIGAPHGIIQQGSISVSFKEEMMSSYANILHPQIIQGIIDSADCNNIKESGLQNVQEAITSNMLKFLSGSRLSSLFVVSGRDTSSKLGPVAKQNMGIMSKDDRTQQKSSHEYGECSKVNENLKHVKSSINRTTVKINENIVSSFAPTKPSVIGTRNNKLPLQPIDENTLSVVHKSSHDALATPDCVITKIVEHSNEKVPEVGVVKKFSVQNGQGTFTRSTSLTGTKNDVGRLRGI
uniref:Aminotransferase-like plant mobile domain-containing protein n=1 Tax=Triticum urartu TaxID=4572 RepID=A0A8R7PHM0_TRIUA